MRGGGYKIRMNDEKIDKGNENVRGGCGGKDIYMKARQGCESRFLFL